MGQKPDAAKPRPKFAGPRTGHVRIATFNVSMNRPKFGQLVKDLVSNDTQIRKVASVIRLQRPDILLLNEFDYDRKQASAIIFANKYLNAERTDVTGEPIEYPYMFTAPVNTGIDSKMDLNRNGKTGEPTDAYGYGTFPGQYGMVLLSKFPIIESDIRTFQKLLWKSMPNASVPVDPKTRQPWYPNSIWNKLRLSSKSHWDVPINVDGSTLHVLASHPTPPAFDGPEKRNGRRNHDEIRFWADYVTQGKGDWITDDAGLTGGANLRDAFVIMGDLNADPADGASYDSAINQLLKLRNVNAKTAPMSEGAAEANDLQKKANLKHTGNSSADTADFSDGGVGNLRVDYVLPSRQIGIFDMGVFWPEKNDPFAVLLDCSDHHMVWLDIAVLAQ
ncbi:MAG: endonuclease/exonuclease/phosphatase family protein [Fuerstiella sp.]